MKKILFFFLLSALPFHLWAQSDIIRTFAGNGTAGYSGDGGQATAAEIGPTGSAVDALGNIYFVDYSVRIRKVSYSGIISTYAGTTVGGFSGDGGAATAAEINDVQGVAADGIGNVYIADFHNNRIRVVYTSGIITTFAGGATGPLGDGGPATNANIGQPANVAVDGVGNVYIADVSHDRIRKVNTAGIITTYAGNGTLGYSGDGGPATAAELDNPFGLFADNAGNVYIGDNSDRIRKVNMSGIITTIAGMTGSAGYSGDGGPATAAQLYGDVFNGSVDGWGNVYIADGGNNRIRKIDTSGIITTVAGNGTAGYYGDGGPATVAELSGPWAVTALTTGAISISDVSNYRVRIIGGQEYVPRFVYHGDSITVCSGYTDSLNATLAVTDSDYWVSDTWSLVSSAAHGTAFVTDTTGADGHTITPAGLYYTAASGYAGSDSFRVRITNGYGSDTATVRVTVTASPGAITGTAHVCAGFATTLSDTAASGTWSSSNTAISTAGTAGIVTGVSAGMDTVSYTFSNGCASTVTVTVNPLPGAITGTTTVCAGGSATLTVTTGGGAWTSGSTAVAVVGSAGAVTGVAAGTATITYALPTGCAAYAVVTVNPLPSVITGTLYLCVGATTNLADSVTGGVWSSGSGVVASVGSGSGVVTGSYAGTAAIMYTLPTGCLETKIVSVNPGPAAIMGVATVCAGATTPLSDATGGGVWNSGATGIATIGSGLGVVTGVAAGVAAVSYTLPTGCAASALVTVDASPSAITGYPAVCFGLTDTLSDTMTGGTWTSSDYSVAYIDAGTGMVTGVAPGTATITYTMLSSGCYTTTPVTVTTSPSAITGIPAACVGATTLLSDAISGGTWTSGSPAIATVGYTSGLVTGASGGSAAITYSIGFGCSTTYTVNITPAPSSITGTLHVCTGGTTTLSSLTTGGVWSSVASGIASIGSSTGVVTGIAAGTSTISYANAITGCATTAIFTVNPLPPAITGTLNVCTGATSTLIDGSGTWLSGSTAIATIGSSTGLLTGISITGGVSGITYTLPTGCSTTATATVNPLPVSINGPAAVCTGAAINLTDGTGGGAWTKSNGNVTLGTTGIVTGITTGTSVISYTLPTGCYATKPVTINSTPGTPIVSGGGTMQLCQAATITVSDATSGGTWTTGTGGDVTIGSLTGLVTGLSAGTQAITYTLVTGCNATATVTVNALPALFTVTGGGSYCAGSTGIHIGLTGSVTGVTYQLFNGGSALLPLAGTGSSLDFGPQTAAGIYTVVATNPTALGGCTRTMTGSAPIAINPLPLPVTGPTAVCIGATATETDPGGGTWTSSTPATATIGSLSGVVSGVAIGTTTITYTLPTTCAITGVVSVSSTPVIISGASTVCTGATTTLTDGVGGGSWSSSTSSATIGSLSGTVTGVAPGTTTITYSLGTGCTVTKAVTVNASPAPITGALGMCVGNTATLASTTTGGIWTSGAITIATIGSAGSVHGIAAGSAGITYSLPTGCNATATVTVNSLPGVISGILHVCQGATTTLTDAAGGGVWSSGSVSIATIGSSSGTVTGSTRGTSLITYSLGTGCTVTATITVNALPAAITGTTQVCPAATTTLSSGTSGGTWSSSLPVATVTSGGVVTGVTAGTTTISYILSTGCAATAVVTVNPLPNAISGTTQICSGSSATLSDLSSGGAWASSSTTTAMIGSGTGTLTGETPGTTTITYTLPTGCLTSMAFTVNAAPAAIGGSTAACAGSSAIVTDATIGGTWSSGATSIATIGSATGAVGAASLGTAPITYTAGGCFVTTTFTVTALPGAISGTPDVCAGATATLSDATLGGVWSSGSVGIATIGSTSGAVFGITPGITTITYSLGAGCTVTMPVSVAPAPPAITGSADICLGATETLTDPATGGAWSSTGIAIAPVTTGGMVTGLAAGTATISYTSSVYGGCAATLNVNVISVPAPVLPASMCAFGDTVLTSDSDTSGIYTSGLVTVTNLGGGAGLVTSVGPGAASVTYTLSSGCSITVLLTINPLPGLITGVDQVCTGNTTMLSNTVTGGTWSSITPGVATIGSTGMVTGIAPGATDIRYTLPTGCRADTLVTVLHPPDPVAIGTGAFKICAGATATLSDSVSGGAWSSSAPAIATIGIGGVVTGTSAGTATITYAMLPTCLTTTTVTIEPLPALYTVTGGGNYCAGASGEHVGLGGSGSGIRYQLYRGATIVGSGLAGTGSALDFGLQTTAGTYTVLATDTTTGCSSTMTGSASVTITPTVTPTVSITVTPGTSLCAGATANFTANPINGGTTPGYHWSVNSVTAALSGNTYSYIPLNGDIISVTLTSDAACAIPATAIYSVTMTVTEPATPIVTINATPGATITTGQYDTLTATIVSGGGASPAYQWQINSAPVAGANTSTWVTDNLANGDTAKCTVTNTDPCGEATTQWLVITVDTISKLNVKITGTDEAISILPNPNKGTFTIKGTLGTLTTGQVTIEITDMVGQQVYSKTATAKGGQLNEEVTLGSNIANATYLLTLHTTSGNKVFHIVVE